MIKVTHVFRLAVLGCLFGNNFRTALSLSFIFYLLFFFLMKSIPDPLTTIHLSATTNTAAFRVSNPTRVGIKLNRVRLDAVDPVEGLFGDTLQSCVSGELYLGLGTVVRYRKDDKNLLIVSIDDIDTEQGPPVVRLANTGEGILLGSGSELLFNPEDSECTSELPNILPIWGPGEIGSEQLDPDASGFLSEGTAQIYARAIEKLFVFSFPPSLYQAGEIIIPAGSRVVEEPQGQKWVGSDWIGSVTIQEKDEAGLFVKVKTNARTLNVYQAGVGNKGYETITVSMFTRQFSDPTLLYIQLQFAIFVVIAEVLTIFISLFPEKSVKIKRNRSLREK